MFATNPRLKGIEEKSANAVLVKLNQIGTVSETMNAIEWPIKMALKQLFHIDPGLRRHIYS